MRFPHAWRTEQQNGFTIGDEAARGDLADLRLVERGLRAEVEAREVTGEGEAGEPISHVDALLAGAIVWFFAARPVATKALTSEIAPILLASAAFVAVRTDTLAKGAFSLRRTLKTCVGLAVLNLVRALLLPVAFPQETMLMQMTGHMSRTLYASLISMPVLIILVLWASSWHQLRRA